MFNLLATKYGRAVTFFLLYMTEGLPQGFTHTAVAVQMKRQGIPTEQITVYVAMLYLPWGFKWIMGPIVDVLYSNRLGRRKGWIVGMQALMIGGLMLSMGIDFTSSLGLYTAIIFGVNVFAATQDVAIDAMAVGVLGEKERGVVNGLMFAGAQFGAMLGGAGVLFLTGSIGFSPSAMVIIALLVAVTSCMILFTSEARYDPPVKDSDANRSPRLRIVLETRTYLHESLRAMFGTTSARAALLFALLPCGSLALSMALGNAIAVEMGMSDMHIAELTSWSSVVWIFCCVAGAFLSDRWGRRKMLAIYVLGLCMTTGAFAVCMASAGYHGPNDAISVAGKPGDTSLIVAFWAASICFAFFQGLMYGTRTALFMDVCDSKVAATQFTAYMAILNLVLTYTGLWQGQVIKHYGYTATLAIDAVFGAVGLLLLPWITPVKQKASTLAIDLIVTPASDKAR